MQLKRKFGFYIYPLTWLVYTIYSYSQTNPNLVLTSWPGYWGFQQAMWQLGYHLRPVSAAVFLGLMLLLMVQYGWLIRETTYLGYKLSQWRGLVFSVILVLLPSYPALSNDIFNYLMNAKMMHVYQASPYQHAAWDFPDDLWLKFMMNVHTTTPYGPVWTGTGYLVYGLTGGDLQFGMLGFRLLAVMAMMVIGWTIHELTGKKSWRASLVFMLNPLILIEAVNNMHNDVVMMALFMAALLWYQKTVPKSLGLAVGGALMFWILSVYTKQVTIIIPILAIGFYIGRKWFRSINLADILVWGLLASMYLDGVKRFFSWYLIWGLTFFSLAKTNFTRRLGFFFSGTGLMAYLVYLYTGEYTLKTWYIRTGILFSVPAGYILYEGIRGLINWVRVIGGRR